jgi:hypothetical protein
MFEWIKRYRKHGLAGLPVDSGHRRKPALSPIYQDHQAAKEARLACGAS